jgi:hypothetical protein
MNKVYSRFCCSLGLTLLLAACGDPAQFNELTFGEPIPAETNPEMSNLPDLTSGDKGKPSTTYAGEEGPSSENERQDEDLAPSETPAPFPAPTDPDTRLFTDCEESPEKGIVANLYELPVDTSRLPDFSSMTALRDVCLSQLNIKDRQFSEGFPGVEGLFEWFALDMQFRVTVPRSGTYEFSLLSDDGAILWINNAKVIDNDGLHEVTEKRASVYLPAGTHTFRVAYYQGPRWRIALELYWKVPGTSTRVHIPASAISRLD